MADNLSAIQYLFNKAFFYLESSVANTILILSLAPSDIASTKSCTVSELSALSTTVGSSSFEVASISLSSNCGNGTGVLLI